MNPILKILDDGLPRCWWGTGSPEYVAYHDDEWGRPSLDLNRLFEKLCLEGFQSGLSWLTVLRKRPAFREAFADFDPVAVASYQETQVEGLLANAGIIRHRGKINSAINNARRALLLQDEEGSFPDWIWRNWADASELPPTDIPSTTIAATRLAADLKKRGFTFVGPTTAYAFMQAMGLVNDHVDGCHVRSACADERRQVIGRTP